MNTVLGISSNMFLNLFYIFLLLCIKLYLVIFGSNIIGYKFVKYCFIFLYPFLIGLNIFFDIRVCLEMALISWWLFAFGLYLYFNSFYKLDLVYAFCVFYSEFYELPIYFLRFWRGSQVMNNSILYVFLRLSVLLYILYMMNKMGYNYIKYLNHLIKLTIVMVPVCWYFLRVPINGYNLLLLLKSIYFVDLINYLNSRGYNKYVL